MSGTNGTQMSPPVEDHKFLNPTFSDLNHNDDFEPAPSSLENTQYAFAKSIKNDEYD